jgi:hypothetical protein
VIHVFVLVILIGGEEEPSTCDTAMCFYDINRCNYFASQLRRRGSPSTSSPINAYCKPILVDPTQEGVRIYGNR